MALAASTRFMAAAPAESTCSHSGIFTCGPARLTTATTSGARARRSRSASICSGAASGYLTRNAATMAEPAARRAFEHDEAPRRELAVIGHPRRHGQQRVDLGCGRGRAGELDRLE